MATKSSTKPVASARRPSRSPPATPSTLRPLHDRDKREAIFDAADSLDVSQTAAWADLDILSNRTQVDGVNLVPEGIFETGSGDFAAAATVYVELQYGGKNDSIASASAFPAQVRGHFEHDGTAVIDSLKVDTSSFYE